MNFPKINAPNSGVKKNNTAKKIFAFVAPLFAALAIIVFNSTAKPIPKIIKTHRIGTDSSGPNPGDSGDWKDDRVKPFACSSLVKKDCNPKTERGMIYFKLTPALPGFPDFPDCLIYVYYHYRVCADERQITIDSVFGYKNDGALNGCSSFLNYMEDLETRAKAGDTNAFKTYYAFMKSLKDRAFQEVTIFEFLFGYFTPTVAGNKKVANGLYDKEGIIDEDFASRYDCKKSTYKLFRSVEGACTEVTTYKNKTLNVPIVVGGQGGNNNGGVGTNGNGLYDGSGLVAHDSLVSGTVISFSTCDFTCCQSLTEICYDKDAPFKYVKKTTRIPYKKEDVNANGDPVCQPPPTSSMNTNSKPIFPISSPRIGITVMGCTDFCADLDVNFNPSKFLGIVGVTANKQVAEAVVVGSKNNRKQNKVSHYKFTKFKENK